MLTVKGSGKSVDYEDVVGQANMLAQLETSTHAHEGRLEVENIHLLRACGSIASILTKDSRELENKLM